MKRKIFFLAVVLFLPVLLFGLIDSASAQFNYSGSLDLDGSTTGSEDGYLEAAATSDWETGPTKIQWTVDWDGTSSWVSYSYTFTYPEHDPSYFIFEVSDNFGYSDIQNVQVDDNSANFEINRFTPDRRDNGGNYQTMPEAIYGVKIDDITACSPEDPNCDGTITLSFESTRMPEWGDFYARCGTRPAHQNDTKEWNSAWNTGFLGDDGTTGLDDTDPTNPPSNGSVNGSPTYSHLLVPDTVVVPEPVSSTLFLVGSSLFAGRRFFRRKK